MPGKSLFGRDDDDPAGAEPDSGRGRRRPPRPGTTKPVDPRPQKRTEGVRLIARTEAPGGGGADEPAAGRGDAAPGYDDLPSVDGLRAAHADEGWAEPDGGAVGDLDLVPWVEGDAAPDEGDKLSVEPTTAETVLPHWTEPPTGEVPRVVIEADPTGDVPLDDGEEDWSGYAAGVRYRDQHDSWDDAGVMDDLVDEAIDAEGARPGALDTDARPTQDEYLSFDDLDVPDQAPPAARAGTVRRDGRTVPQEPPTERRRPRGSSVRPRREAPAAPQPPADGPADAAPGDGGRDIGLAAAVGVGMGVAALIVFRFGGPAWSLVLALIVIGACGVEFLTSIRQAGFRPIVPLGLAAVVGLPLAGWFRGEPGLPLVLFLFLAFAFLWYLLGITGSRPLRNLGVTTFAVVWIGLFGAYAALILKIGRVPVSGGGLTDVDQGVSILVLAIVASLGYDVGGLFIGRRFGRTPFSSASPNKTLEGLVGGMACAVVLVVVVGGFFHLGPFSVGQAVVFGALCALAAPLGDLGESLLKRDLGIKDMGSVIPGHGGVLDRFDNLLFVLPAAYYATRVLLELQVTVG